MSSQNCSSHKPAPSPLDGWENSEEVFSDWAQEVGDAIFSREDASKAFQHLHSRCPSFSIVNGSGGHTDQPKDTGLPKEKYQNVLT